MSAAGAPPLVDARGLRCPWPLLRLARALREAPAALLVADDPATAGELAALAALRGWQVAPAETTLGPAFRVARVAGRDAS